MPAHRKRTDEELSVPVGSSLLSPYDIRRMRMRMGMFQRDLAEALNITPRMVRYWEQGRKPIPTLHAAKLWSVHKTALEGDFEPMKKRDPRKTLLRQMRTT